MLSDCLFLLGLTQIEATVAVLVEIIHAFTIVDPEFVGLAVKLYILLLFSEVSFIVAYPCHL